MKLFIYLFLFIFFQDMLFATDGELYNDFIKWLDKLKIIFLMGKISGFLIIIWGINELNKDGYNKQESTGQTILKSIIKLIIGSFLISSQMFFEKITGITLH
jgi:hypothetical protein